MAHAKIEGENKWITPRVVMGDKVLNALPGGTPIARGIAYIIEAMEYSSDKVNRFANKTARENAFSVKDALTGSGKPGDKFIYAMPKADKMDEFVNVFETTRDDILKACESIISIDSIMKDAENKADEIRVKASTLTVKVINPLPVYTEAGTRAKKSSGTFKI